MKCFPVIYTRTNQCDYYADFHVLPEFVCAGNLMKYIKSATYGLDSAKNTIKKELLFSEKDYCVFGYICFIQTMCENLKEYSCDSKGRPIFGFFGFAVKKSTEESNLIPVLDLNLCAEVFEKYIVPVWEDTSSSTVYPDEMELPDCEYKETETEPDFKLQKTEFYSNHSGILEKSLYEAICMKKDVSYCSDISNFKKLQECIFSYIVTSNNNISRLQAEERQREEEILSEQDEQNQYQIQQAQKTGFLQNLGQNLNLDKLEKDDVNTIVGGGLIGVGTCCTLVGFPVLGVPMVAGGVYIWGNALKNRENRKKNEADVFNSAPDSGVQEDELSEFDNKDRGERHGR